ncbi:efflux RND transporter permease subunit, partial [Steroidobacter sp.]|uniref:efflux RND transporter permease subunit n=1 Tax=Steroidobacter sp. TaxID=1978227 RepID=UPI001A437ED8
MPPDTVSSESLAPGLDRWLRFTVRRPLFIVACALLLTVLAAISATRLHKDTSANAYIEPDNPALLYREKVIETFGLKEPIVIAVVGSSPAGILSVDSLRLVRDLVERVERIPNVDPDRIVSVVSQSSIRGGADTLEVSPLLPAGEIDALTVTTLREALDSTTLYDGTLVARDRSATVIVAELLDERQSAATYQAVLDLTRSIAKPGGIELHVAGAGAITGYFSTYIDRDAGRLVPFTAIAVSMVLFCAFFSTRSSALPMLIAAMTVIATLGAMAASGVAFYAITNGMVVVLIGISVAEPMHVFGEYYALLRNRPTLSNAELVRGALRNVWWPIALTSVTTLVGFLSLWLTSTMPPIRYFGLFGAFGVLVAWVLTVSLLPAAMALLPKGAPKESPSPERAPDAVSRFMFAVGGRVIRAPRTVLAVTAILSVAALSAAALVRVDHARIENFNADEPIYIADREINRVLAGTNQLDIVIESSSDDGILMPEALRRIDALQTYVTS